MLLKFDWEKDSMISFNFSLQSIEEGTFAGRAVPSVAACIASLGGDPELIQSPTCFLEFRSSLGSGKIVDTPWHPKNAAEAFEGCWSAERAQRQRGWDLFDIHGLHWITMDYHGIPSGKLT